MQTEPMTNLSIAQDTRLRPILDVAADAGLLEDDFESLGRYKGKLTYSAMGRLSAAPKNGKLILVTAITPTPAGEGKTTTCVGLAQGLRKLGKNAMPAVREPAMGPVFGVKGGGCGGGYSQVLPMEDINLSFTGDFGAVVAAHNLLSAMADAHVQNGNETRLDVRNFSWPRTLDVNDRALRETIVGLGGKGNGYPRQEGFVIAPASEVMAVLALSRSISELRERLGRVIVGMTPDNQPVTAADLRANGAMAAILRDAIRPNLVQTVEGCPAFVHAGPFGNIAHGCSSVIATECGLALSDYVVTEAGFAADLGAEKFLNIVCRSLGRGPDAIVLVATVRALKHHGGEDSLEGVRAGMDNLFRHATHLGLYGPPLVVAINRRPGDTDDEHRMIIDLCSEKRLKAVVADPWGGGGVGCVDLAEEVALGAETKGEFRHLYELKDSEQAKLNKIATLAYGGEGCEFTKLALSHTKWGEDHGYGELPVCVAKTQNSLSDDPKRPGAPTGFTIQIRDVKLSAGAGFVVAYAGDIMLMPGLGADPAALHIDVDAHGKITGLF